MWLRLRPRTGARVPVHIGVVYMPVAGTPVADVRVAYSQLKADVQTRRAAGGEVCVLGDFNARVGCAPQAGMHVGQFGETERNSNGDIMLAFLRDTALYALNGRVPCATPEYTREELSTDQRSVLDYVLLSESALPASRLQVADLWPVSNTDHHMVIAQTPLGVGIHPRRGGARPAPITRPRVRLLTDADPADPEALARQREQYGEAAKLHGAHYAAFVANLQREVAGGVTGTEAAVSAAKAELVRILIAAVEDSIGFQTKRVANTSPGFSPAVRAAVIAKRAVARTFKLDGSVANKEALQRARKVVSQLMQQEQQARRSAQDANIVRLFNARNNADSVLGERQFWRAINSAYRKPRAGDKLSMIRDQEGCVVAEPADVAAAFAAHYQKVSSASSFAEGAGFDDTHFAAIEAEVQDFRVRVSHTDEGVDAAVNVDITGEELHTALGQLHNNTAGSPHDQLANELLKYGGEAAHAMLLEFFGMQWGLEVKCQTPGVITNIFKAGDKLDPNNYRPITLNSVLDKLYNRILNNRIMNCMETHKLLHEGQNGFRQKRDCVQHIYTLHTVLQGRQQAGQSTLVFLLDIQKAYDTVWRAGCMWHVWQKGIRGKMFRVLCQLYDSTCSQVVHEGAMSDEVAFDLGLAQGDTLSPTLFAVFVDSMLQDVWSQHPGVPLENTDIGKLVALMFADDYAGVADSADALQAQINFIRAHLVRWRLKANISKSAVLVVEGKASSHQAPAADTQVIHWGTEAVPVKDAYKYLGVMLHNTLKWDAHMKYVSEKATKAVRALYPMLLNRSISVEIKRMMLLTVVRPVIEHAGHVWNPHTKNGKAFIDRLQMDFIKAVMHCAPTTSHILLQQELGMRPMSAWLDKRMLELWHTLQNMPDARLPKQVSSMQWSKGPGVKRVVPLWGARADKMLQEYSIDPVQGKTMAYSQFKTLVHKKAKEIQKGALERAAAVGVVRDYVQQFGSKVQYAGPAGFLQHGACGRGRELMLKLRTQSLALKGVTGKFGRRDSDNRAEEVRAASRCPVCDAGCAETGQHFLLDCQFYRDERADMFETLNECVPSAMGRFASMPAEKKFWVLLDDALWKEGGVAEGGFSDKAIGSVASFVARAWKKRNVHIHEGLRGQVAGQQGVAAGRGVGDHNGTFVNMDEASLAVAISPAVAPLVRHPTEMVGSRRRVLTPSSRAGAGDCSVGVCPRHVSSRVPLLRGPGVGEVFPGRIITRHLGSVLLAQSNAAALALRGYERETDGGNPVV
jgi:hypothetical protein